MDIGTAKLTVAQRRGITHHQIDVLDVTEIATVARYQAAATRDIEELLAAGRTPVIVGGSMLYIQGLLDDWKFPATDPQVRARYEEMLAQIGVAALHRRLAEVDPAAAESILDTDGRRIVRALEVVELTGEPFAASLPRSVKRAGVQGFSLSTEKPLTLTSGLPRAPRRCSPTAWSTRWPGWPRTGCVRGSPRAGRSDTPDPGRPRRRVRPRPGRRADRHRHPALCSPATFLVPT